MTKFLKTLKNTAYFPIQQVAIRGDFDFMLCARGRYVGLELKKDAKQGIRGLQSYKKEWVEQCGGLHFEVYPENFSSLKDTLRKLDGT